MSPNMSSELLMVYVLNLITRENYLCKLQQLLQFSFINLFFILTIVLFKIFHSCFHRCDML